MDEVLKERYKNAILITIDSLRWNAIFSHEGKIKEGLEFLKSIEKNSIIFRNAFSNGAGTPACFPSIMTSTYPLMYGGYKGISKSRIPIAEILNEKGVLTIGISNNAYLSKFFGYDRGFRFFLDGINEKNTSFSRKAIYRLSTLLNKNKFLLDMGQGINMFFNINPPYMEGDEINKSLLEIISNIDSKNISPFFIWLHYMDSHIPYYSPKIESGFHNFQIRKLHFKLWLYEHAKWIISKEDLCSIQQLYLLKVKYLDKKLSELIKMLEERKMMDNTLVIITADHGEEFLDHGSFIHTPKLYDELIHIPLIIFSKDIKGPIYVDDLVEHLDIPLTIVKSFGVFPPKQYLGNSLFDIAMGKNKKDYIISEVAQPKHKLEIDYNMRKVSIRTKKFKVIWDKKSNKVEFYNIQTDSQEKINKADKNKEVVLMFNEIIKSHILKETITNIGKANI